MRGVSAGLQRGLQRLAIRRFDRRWEELGPEVRFSLIRDRLTSTTSRSARRFAEMFAHDERMDDVRDHEDPVDRAIALGQSLLRFGDGEAAVLLGSAIWQVHAASEPVRRELLEVLHRALDSPACRVGISGNALLPDEAFFAQEKPQLWMRLRGLAALSRRFSAAPPRFFDGEIFRNGSSDPSLLWRSAERVVLVTNDRVAGLAKERRIFGDREVLQVAVPEREAVSSAQSLTDGVRAHYRRHGVDNADVPVIIGAGVAGKLVGGRLFEDFRVYDLGHYLGPKHPEGRRGGAWRP